MDYDDTLGGDLGRACKLVAGIYNELRSAQGLGPQEALGLVPHVIAMMRMATGDRRDREVAAATMAMWERGITEAVRAFGGIVGGATDGADVIGAVDLPGSSGKRS